MVKYTANDCAWDPTKGEGRVVANAGDYDDAVRVKRNTLVLFLVNLFGGLAPEAVKHVYVLRDRAKALDRTEYARLGATKNQSFVEYLSERMRGGASNAFRGSAPRRSMPSEARLSAAPPPHAHKAEGANLRAG